MLGLRPVRFGRFGASRRAQDLSGDAPKPPEAEPRCRAIVVRDFARMGFRVVWDFALYGISRRFLAVDVFGAQP